MAINLENDLSQIHRHLVVKCCPYCKNFSKAKAFINQRMKYLRVMKVKAETSDKMTDKLGELREIKKENVQLGHKIDELQHRIDSMEEVEAKKREGLDEEIVKLLEDKLDLQKRVRAEQERNELLSMQVNNVLDQRLEDYENIPKNFSITDKLKCLKGHQDKEIA